MLIVPASIGLFGDTTAGDSTGYQPAGALYLDTSDSLTRTNSSASDNTKKVTVSLWVKMLSHTTAASIIRLNSPDFDRLNMEESGSDDAHFTLTVDGGNNDSWGNRQWRHPKKVRDLTGWQNLVFTFDSTASSGDRFRIFDNGVERDPVEQTGSDFASDTTINWMANSKSPIILSSGEWLVADYIVMDGIGVTNADNFGELSDNGIWVPKDPSTISSFGTNGFWLDFSNGADIGNDASGNNNDFTPTSMGANNIVVDGPVNSTDKEITLYPALEETDGYDNSGTMALSNNNLTGTPDNNNEHTRYLNLSINKADTTKYYFEISCGSGNDFGAMFVNDEITRTSTGRAQANTWTGAIESTSELRWWEETDNSQLGRKPAISTYDYSNDRLCFAIDGNNSKIWVGHYDHSASSTTWANNNTGSPGMDANPASGSDAGTLSFDFTTTTGNMYIALYQSNGSSRASTIHLTSSSWSGSAPSGFNALTKTVTGIGNVATLDPLQFNGTISEGNLKHTADTSGYVNASIGTVSASSGKFYHEIDMVSSIDSTTTFGVVNVGDKAATRMDQNSSHYVGHANGGGWAYKPGSTPKKWTNSTQENYGVNVTDGDTLQVYTDLDNGKLYFGKDGTLMESANLTNGTGYAYDTLSGQIVPAFGIYNGDVIRVRFSPEDWLFTPDHSDYKAWSTQNIAEPTVTDPSAFFKAKAYEGNGTAIGSGGNAVAVGFQPDFVWIKNRDQNDDHRLFDAIRGAQNYLEPNSQNDQNQATDRSLTYPAGGYAEMLNAFTATGFNLGDNVSVNTNNESYMAWCLKANGAGSSDDSGGITVTRSTASHQGFSICKGTSTSGTQNFTHGLGAKPEMVILRDLEDNSQHWQVQHKDVNTNMKDITTLGLNRDNAAGSSSNWWGTEPSSTLQYFTTNQVTSTNDFVCYLFRRIPGIIGIGGYTGGGSSYPHIIIDDGGSGFKPAFILGKQTNASGQPWWIVDAAREPFNSGNGNMLFPNTNAVEADNSGNTIDFVSNGFKLRSADTHLNASGSTYIYLAFAETSFGLNNRAR